jgi:ParB family transcriptional regulator, chromosome partitioning protein
MPQENKKRSGLGKGLAAIISENPNLQFKDSGFIPDLDINSVEPNPNQPRATIKPDDLIGLADSIREHGILEPIIVKQNLGDKYQLVAGERRWRAAKLAQMQTVPVLVKDLSPQEILEVAVIENIQRKDLNPIEEATALAELYGKYRIKLEDLAKKVGKEKSTISNKMRLLKLPYEIQQGMLDEKLTESHAYMILALTNQDAMIVAYNMIVKNKLGVRQTEDLVRKLNLANDSVEKKQKSNAVIYDAKTEKIDTVLSQQLGKGYRLVRKKDGGRITIPFQSEQQLDILYKLLMSKDFKHKTKSSKK